MRFLHAESCLPLAWPYEESCYFIYNGPGPGTIATWFASERHRRSWSFPFVAVNRRKGEGVFKSFVLASPEKHDSEDVRTVRVAVTGKYAAFRAHSTT